jgi:transcriptional regulator with XRE-family HTH domain
VNKRGGPLQCDIRVNFAKAFGAWRTKHHLLLKNVAVDLGVSLATVNKWERGERFPSAQHFQALVDYTGIPPCKLFCIIADKCVPAECLLAMRK